MSKGKGKKPKRKKKHKGKPPPKRKRIWSDNLEAVLRKPFTLYHLRAGFDLQVTTSHLWRMAEKEWLTILRGRYLTINSDSKLTKHSFHSKKERKYLWYSLDEAHLNDVIGELTEIDAKERLGGETDPYAGTTE